MVGPGPGPLRRKGGFVPPFGNQISNWQMAGASPPSTPPTGMFLSAGLGIAAQVVANGPGWIEFRWSGTSTGTVFPTLWLAPVQTIAAAPGQVWHQDIDIAVVAGSLANIASVSHNRYEEGAGGAFIASTGFNITGITGVSKRDGGNYPALLASVVTFRPSVIAFVNGVQTIDVTLRVGRPVVYRIS